MPDLKAFPTEFPADAALKIGQAILAKSFDRSLIEPIYELVGYGLYVLTGGSAPFPKPTFGAGLDDNLTDEQVALELVAAAGPPSTFGARFTETNAKALPWGLILKIALAILGGLLAKPGEDDTQDHPPV